MWKSVNKMECMIAENSWDDLYEYLVEEYAKFSCRIDFPDPLPTSRFVHIDLKAIHFQIQPQLLLKDFYSLDKTHETLTFFEFCNTAFREYSILDILYIYYIYQMNVHWELRNMFEMLWTHRA